MNYVAIMAGGIGSRFWPASTAAHPKQFLDIMGTGRSLLKQTYDRFAKLLPPQNIYVVTNQQYQPLVHEHLPELPLRQILCEPSHNNTAPCVAYTAFKIQDLDEHARIIIAPSDHLVKEESRFLEYMEKGLAFAQQHEGLLTLGILPSGPHTGYGYIEYEDEITKGIFSVKAFKEKPTREKAQAYLSTGSYLWNAGIFIWKAADVLRAFELHAPDIYNVLNKGAEYWNTEKETAFLKEYYPKTPNISIDYAIMERANNVYTMPASFGWSDLGSWTALHEELSYDATGNATTSRHTFLQNTYDSLIAAPSHKRIVIKGLSDYIVVDTDDTLMIYPKSEAQSIKQLRDDALRHFEQS